jgi:hypothetical protein
VDSSRHARRRWIERDQSIEGDEDRRVRYGIRVMLARACSLLLLCLAACGGDSETPAPVPNRPPVVDGVEASAEVAASGGRYVTPVKVTFHDDDNDAVTKIRLRIPDGNYDETTTIQGAVPQAKSATLTMDFDAATVAAGTYEYLVSVMDAQGNESQPVTKTVTFK